VRQDQEAADLLANRAQHLHIATGVEPRLTMLHIDHTHYFVLGDDRDREESLERILGKVFEVFEPWIVVGFSRNG
jgi:hypothetical protein